MKFYSTAVIGEIISSVGDITSNDLLQIYLPQFVGAIVLSEILDYFTRRYAEELPYLYIDYASLKFSVSWLTLRSTHLLSVSKERLQQLTSKYLDGVQSFLNDWVWRTPAELTKLVIICALLAFQSPLVLLANIAVMAVYFWIAFLNSRRYSVYWEAYLRASVQNRSYLQNVVTQLATVQRLAALPILRSTAADHAVTSGRSMQDVKKFHGYRWLVQLNFFNLIYAITFFVGVYQVIHGTLPLGFLILIKWAYDSLWDVMQYSIEAYVQLIGQRESSILVRNEIKNLHGYLPQSTVSIPKTWRTLELRLASMDYKLEERRRIHVDVPKLTLRSGSHVALTGPSGSGKTTLFHMLLNLVQFEGTYELDGRSIRGSQLDPSSIAVVTATDGFFPLSIRENLTLGRNIEESELHRVLAGLHVDFVIDLEEKFGSGIAFSSGQLQRLRLARGLLSGAIVFLLDEPFTGIDEAAKSHITAFMSTELREKTVVIVTHDPRELTSFRVDDQYAFDGHTLISCKVSDFGN